jgi:hypothetical protein
MREDAMMVYKDELACDPKRRRRMYTACSTQIEGTWVPSVHADCNHNEIAALLKRSLAPTPKAGVDSRLPVIRVFNRIRKLTRGYGGERWSYLETANSYSGALRRRYLEAEASLSRDEPLERRDTLLSAFLKAEKFGYGKYGKPRMIFPRSPRYNLALASYLKPLEHYLWGILTARRLFKGSNTRVVAKGLNLHQRASLIVRKFREMEDCVCFEVDGSAFEAHVDVWQLQQEHAVYLAAYRGDHELANLLARQLVNEGTTKGGVWFTRAGGRASGDFNTGMGNTLIMLSVVVSTLRAIGVEFDVLADGDNSLVFLHRWDVPRVVANFRNLALKNSGHEMVLERPVDVIEEIRFGQCAPVEWDHGRWVMVRDWAKVISQMTSNHAHINNITFAPKYLRAVAECELSLNAGLPIVQNLCARIKEQTTYGKSKVFSLLRDYEAMGVRLDGVGKAQFRAVTPLCRESYCRAFGVTATRQEEIEARLSSLELTFNNWVPEESPWSLDSLLDARPGLVESFFDVRV